MTAFVQGWGLTAASLALIALVFVIAYARLSAELRYIRVLTDFLGYELVREGETAHKPEPSLIVDQVRDQVDAVRKASDPVWAMRQVRSWQMRVWRLETALAFWVDLLRQLGLLGTVVGLGLAMAIDRDVSKLLTPLGLAVWTTVLGLALSIWLSAQFSGKLAAWADACEKNLEAWETRRAAARKGAGS